MISQLSSRVVNNVSKRSTDSLFHFRSGEDLPDMHLPSDDELDGLYPSIIDNEMYLEQWLDAQMEHDDLPGINNYGDLTFDDQAYYRDVTVNNVNFYDAYQYVSEFCELEDIVDHIEYKYHVNLPEVLHNDPDVEDLHPNFAWSPAEKLSRKLLTSPHDGHEALNTFLSESNSSHAFQLSMYTAGTKLSPWILSTQLLLR